MTYSGAWGRRAACSLLGLTMAVAVTVGWSSVPANASSAGESFVQMIADNVVATIKSGGSKAQKTQKFASVFTRHADIKSIGTYALGKYSKKVSSAQRTKYFRLIKPYVSRVFLARMTDAAVDKVVINSSRVRGSNEELVKSSVKFSDGRPDLPISWRLRRKGGGFKVIDLVVSGVSMIKAQRDEFTAKIRSSDVDGLLKYMGG